MEERYCQSCAMPMEANSQMYGTNADGSRSKDYCQYCWENGVFTAECTMDEMIEICVPHMVSANPSMTDEDARGMMKKYFPTLKRWKTL